MRPNSTSPRRSVTVTPELKVAPEPSARSGRRRPGIAGDRSRRQRPAGRAGSGKGGEVAAADLRRLEDALLGSLLDAHPNRDRALDRLLDDLAPGASHGRPAARPRPGVWLPAAPPAGLRRIEDLLVAVVIDSHPRREASLDRLLDDLAEAEAERRARAAYDAACDNDFDGLS